MPNRNVEGNYRYKYQGQEKDPETGKEAFELRLWDARIGRWLTTDPYGEFSSPYLGMGNNPISLTDPDGGMTDGCCDDRPIKTEVLDEVFIHNIKKSDMHSGFNWTGNAKLDWLNATAYKSYWSNQFKGFAENFDAGATNWKKGDIGYDLMMYTSVAIATPLIATSPVTAALGQQYLSGWARLSTAQKIGNMGGNFFGQFLSNGGDLSRIDFFDVGMGYFGGISSILTQSVVNINMHQGLHFTTNGNHTAIDMTGKYASSYFIQNSLINNPLVPMQYQFLGNFTLRAMGGGFIQGTASSLKVD